MGLGDVEAFLGNSRNRHILIQAHVVLIAGEGVLANGLSLGQIDISQAAVIVEGAVTNDRIGAQGDLLQLAGKGESALTNGGIITNGQRRQSGIKGVVEVSLATLVVVLDLIAAILIDREGIIADLNIIADDDLSQSQALTEDTLGQHHAVRDGNFSQLGV